jgi:hypothetical protein
MALKGPEDVAASPIMLKAIAEIAKTEVTPAIVLLIGEGELIHEF